MRISRFLLIILIVSLSGTGLLFYISYSKNTSFSLLQVTSTIKQGGLLHKQQQQLDEDVTSSDDVASDDEVRDGYIVSTPHCQIPDVDLWHSSVLPYVKKDTPSLSCGETLAKPDLTYVEGDSLVVNSTNIPAYGGRLKHCEYVEIIRPKEGDSSFDLGHKHYEFQNRITIKKEFIKVYCYSQNDTLIYKNLHAITPTKPAMRHFKDNLFMRHKRRGYLEHLNVLMIGVDSVSRLNFHRQFPETTRILKEKLGAYEMYGYNKVRDNTFVNLVPLFLGQYVEETGWNETVSAEFDKQQYAWKRFASSGYHTLFAEDAPEIAIWNFEKPGFLHSPADYYLRPYSLAMSAETKMWHNHNHCFGERLETDIVLDYNHRFIKTRQGAPYFAFTFLTKPTYDTVNQNTDKSHADFLNKLINSNLIENTMVIYFSDHGARRGDILSTYIGKLEERLPAMFISLPYWFRRKYPQIARNLETNQHILTTPFDINSLLDDVLRFNGQPHQDIPADRRSISLFDKVPKDRSCLSSSIDDHWCTCLQKVHVPVNDKKVKKSAEAVIVHINNITSSVREKCVIYKLDKITDAMKSVANNKLLTFKASINDVIGRKEYYGEEATGRLTLYHITVVVSPSGGVYQATVRHDGSDGSYTVSGDISRTSLYGNASWCVRDHIMKKYCYCTEQPPS